VKDELARTYEALGQANAAFASLKVQYDSLNANYEVAKSLGRDISALP
jgi:hypothetical protein